MCVRPKAITDAPPPKAHLTLKRRFRYEHGISSPIETRGVVAQWDERAEHMTVWDTTQAPVFVRNGWRARSVSAKARCG